MDLGGLLEGFVPVEGFAVGAETPAAAGAHGTSPGLGPVLAVETRSGRPEEVVASLGEPLRDPVDRGRRDDEHPEEPEKKQEGHRAPDL